MVVNNCSPDFFVLTDSHPNVHKKKQFLKEPFVPLNLPIEVWASAAAVVNDSGITSFSGKILPR